MSNQLSMTSRGQEEGSTLKPSKQVPFSLLLPIIQPQLDKDKATRLQTFYRNLQKREISKDVFIRKLRHVVGDQKLKMAVYKLQTQAASCAENSSVQIQSQKASSTGQLQVSLSAAVLQESGQIAGTGMSHQQTMALGMSNQPSMTSRCQEEGSRLKFSKQVAFALLLPIIQPQFDKDKAMRLQTLYSNLKKREISKDVFVRKLRSIVGDQILKMAVYKLQTQAASSAENSSVQIQLQKASTRQLQVPSSDVAPDLQDVQNTSTASQPTTAQTEAVPIRNSYRESNPEREKQMHRLQNMSDQRSIIPYNQQSMAMELNDQQPLSESRGNQQTSIGIHNDQTMAIMNPHAKEMGVRRQTVASRISNQLSVTRRQPAGAALKLNKQAVFGLAFPMIQPQLDKDNEMRLHTIYLKIKRNEISKENFVQQVRSIVGDELLKMIVPELQTQQAAMNVEDSAAQSQSQPQA